MRRKLFFIVIIIICLIFFLDMLGISLSNNSNNSFSSESKLYEGRILTITLKEAENYKLVVKLSTKEKVLLNYYGEMSNSSSYIGSIIRFETSLNDPLGRTNPRCFDYQKHLKSLGIIKVGAITSFKEIEKAQNLWYKFNKYLISKKESFLESVHNEDAKGLISGILFGDKVLLDDSIYDEFKKNGTAHVLAVSGLHIGLIYQILQKIIGKSQSLTNIIIIVVVLGIFGTLASWTASVTRAIGMVLIKIIANYTDRRYDMLTAMSFVALVLVVMNPYVVFNVSFQMSFLAVVSIAYIMPHISLMIPDFVAITLAVNLGMSIYQIYQFNTFSITSLVANIPVVYIISILMPLSAIMFVISILGLELSFLYYVLESLCVFIIKINSITTFGIDDLNILCPPIWLAILLYASLFFLLSEYFVILMCRKNIKKIVIIVITICTASLVISFLTFEPISKDEIIFLDVGQGDCIHVRDGDKNVLIDGGGNASYNVGEKILKPYLLKNGVIIIDLALATHLHTDHYKGLIELDEEGLVDNIKTRLTAGETFILSSKVKIETLWPLKGENNSDPNQDENQNCSVFMIYFDEIKIIVTGDLDATGEEKMMQYYSDTQVLDADILKIGHHGSKYSTSDEFLDVVSPKYCIIQVGKNNYGHPHIKTIEKINEKGIMLLRTDVNGAIGFSIDENTVEYHTMIKDK